MRCMISTDNHVKFAHFVLLAVSKKQKYDIFCSMYNGVKGYQPLIGLRIINLSLQLQLITLTLTLIILDITKTSFNN